MDIETSIPLNVEFYIPYKHTKSQSLLKLIGPQKISVYCSTPTIDKEQKNKPSLMIKDDLFSHVFFANIFPNLLFVWS